MSRRHRETEFELDLTTFINLMVVLLSFLLISSVVREVSVLQVNLPAHASGKNSASAPPKKPLILEIMLYPHHLLVADRQTGPLKDIPDVHNQHDFASLSVYLQQVKTQYPAIREASILSQPTTAYDDLVHAMDAVRYHDEEVGSNTIHSALFPDIALGDAPADPLSGTGTGSATAGSSYAP